MYRYPLNRPYISGNELEYIKDALENRQLAGDGPYTQRCRKLLESIFHGSKVLLTTSCTHALEITALLLSIGEGDEFIVPSFTFVSTVNAFALRGARPVFVDIRPDTLNMDETQLELLITPRTKAILPVHYMGVGCEMDEINRVSIKHNIPVIEDNAHGFLGKYQGQWLGTFGRFAALSFHETKNFTCGEGGALMINDEDYYEQAEILREKGTNRSQFLRGEADAYSWVELGSSFLPSDLLAAVLYAQLEEKEGIQAKRKRIWDRYFHELSDWGDRMGIQLPTIPNECEHPSHQFYILMPNESLRTRLIKHLHAQGIQSAFHYLPLHVSKQGQKYGYQKGGCPIAEDVCSRLIRFPFYNDLKDEDMDYIIKSITSF